MPHPNAPAMSQWVGYLECRPEARLQRCVRCCQDVSFLERQPARPIRGTSSHARYERSRIDLATIVVGAVVVRWEEINVIDPSTGDIIDTSLVKSLVPMMTRGLGCPDCQWMMAQVQAAAAWEAEVAEVEYRTIWIRDRQVYSANNIALPTSIAQRSRPQVREVRICLTPSSRTPFIDVTEDVARCERRSGPFEPATQIKVIVRGHGPLAGITHNTQSSLLGSLCESLILGLIDNVRPIDSLVAAAKTAAHIAHVVEPGLKLLVNEGTPARS